MIAALAPKIIIVCLRDGELKQPALRHWLRHYGQLLNSRPGDTISDTIFLTDKPDCFSLRYLP